MNNIYKLFQDSIRYSLDHLKRKMIVNCKVNPFLHYSAFRRLLKKKNIYIYIYIYPKMDTYRLPTRRCGAHMIFFL